MTRSRARKAIGERIEMRWLIVSIFLLMMVPVTIARMTGWRIGPWRSGSTDGSKSILHECKRIATSLAPLAYSGL